MTRYLVATASEGVTEAACDYLDGRLEPTDVVFVLTVDDDRDTADDGPERADADARTDDGEGGADGGGADEDGADEDDVDEDDGGEDDGGEGGANEDGVAEDGVDGNGTNGNGADDDHADDDREEVDRTDRTDRTDPTDRDAALALAQATLTTAGTVRTFRRRGRPDREIVAFVRENDIDEIIMGPSRGPGASTIGTTTRAVLNAVDRPVFVVPL